MRIYHALLLPIAASSQVARILSIFPTQVEVVFPLSKPPVKYLVTFTFHLVLLHTASS